MRQALGIGVVMTMLVTPAMASFFDNFDNYANGNLYGQGTWDKGNSTSWIQVENGMVKIVGGDTGSGDRTVGSEAMTGLTGTIYVEFDILKATTDAGTSWSVFADDDGTPDGNLARAYGRGGTVRGRIDGQGIVTGEDPLATGWNHIQIVIDTAANTDTFYKNGVLLSGTNPISHAGYAGDVLQRISFHKVNPGADTVYVDNLWVDNVPFPEPATLSLLALGALFVGRRRARA